jgi:hypothetical protein
MVAEHEETNGMSSATAMKNLVSSQLPILENLDDLLPPGKASQGYLLSPEFLFQEKNLVELPREPIIYASTSTTTATFYLFRASHFPGSSRKPIILLFTFPNEHSPFRASGSNKRAARHQKMPCYEVCRCLVNPLHTRFSISLLALVSGNHFRVSGVIEARRWKHLRIHVCSEFSTSFPQY